MKEFNLSEEREKIKNITLKNYEKFTRGNIEELFDAIKEVDLEFIKRLKEETRKIDGAKIGRTDGYVISIGRMIGIIDKLAGDKLIENSKVSGGKDE